MPCRKNPYYCDPPEISEWDDEADNTPDRSADKGKEVDSNGKPNNTQDSFTIELCRPALNPANLVIIRCIPQLICQPFTTPGKDK